MTMTAFGGADWEACRGAVATARAPGRRRPHASPRRLACHCVARCSAARSAATALLPPSELLRVPEALELAPRVMARWPLARRRSSDASVGPGCATVPLLSPAALHSRHRQSTCPEPPPSESTRTLRHSRGARVAPVANARPANFERARLARGSGPARWLPLERRVPSPPKESAFSPPPPLLPPSLCSS